MIEPLNHAIDEAINAAAVAGRDCDSLLLSVAAKERVDALGLAVVRAESPAERATYKGKKIYVAPLYGGPPLAFLDRTKEGLVQAILLKGIKVVGVDLVSPDALHMTLSPFVTGELFDLMVLTARVCVYQERESGGLI